MGSKNTIPTESGPNSPNNIEILQRLANAGEPARLKVLGDMEVRVREPSVQMLPYILEKVQPLLDSFNMEDRTIPQLIAGLLQKEETKDILLYFARHLTYVDGEILPNEVFEAMGASDWVAWAVAFKEALHWEELKANFSLLVPPEALSELKRIAQVETAQEESLTQ